MKFFIFMLSLTSLNSFAATNAGNLNITPNSLKLKIYKFAVSTSPLCTNLITVVDNGSTPTEVDFLNNPNLGNGVLANGTYPCVAIEFADNLKFRVPAASTSGNCVTGADNILDVCSTGNNGTSKLINGTTTTCGVSGTNDKVTMYLSTASTSTTSSDAFNPPTSIGDGARGFKLNAALVVTGTSTGKFVVNPTNKVCDRADDNCDSGGGTTCEMLPPTFGFSKVE
jgi:hypothetical protein